MTGPFLSRALCTPTDWPSSKLGTGLVVTSQSTSILHLGHCRLRCYGGIRFPILDKHLRCQITPRCAVFISKKPKNMLYDLNFRSPVLTNPLGFFSTMRLFSLLWSTIVHPTDQFKKLLWRANL